jgi:predicted Zn-dependent protease
LYAEAKRLHGAGQWTAVEAVFGRIRALDAAAPDPDGLLASARAARTAEERTRRAAALYGEGTRLLDAGELEAARARLQELQSLEPGYEQTDALLERIAEEGRAGREEVRRPLASQDQPPPLPPSVRKALSIVLVLLILILVFLIVSIMSYQVPE